MRIKDIKTDLLDMTEEELREKIRSIRSDRIIRKESKKAKVTKTREKVKTVDKAAKLLEGMSQEELAALLKELE